MTKILVTPLEACNAWEGMREELGSLRPDAEVVLTHGQVDDESRLADLLAQVDGAILGLERVDAKALSGATALRVISRFGVGYDAIDLEVLRERHIRLAITRGTQHPAVARQTIAFLLAITFNLPGHARRMRSGEWLRVPNMSCGDTTIGIVGMGAVGREVAALAGALGFRVLAYSRSPFSVEHAAAAASLKELIERSDVVILNVALNAETRGLISGEVLSWLAGKSLINTARGAIVSEPDVLRALDSGELSCYAADVFREEPLSGISQDLAKHDRVLCTPHVGAMDPATARLMLRRAFENAINCLAGADDKVEAYVL